ncbi:MAG: CaiB/BaiF CoA transferase family protein [Acidimicrobiales bacterium]
MAETNGANDERPLDGIRVVELTQWVAGPSTAGLMADFGADVIKVEAPSGDPQRAFLAALGVDKKIANPSFAQDNRGKRSIVLDLTDPDDREVMYELLAEADVFVTNMRLKPLARLGLDPQEVHQRFPGLVVASQTGYGSVGPDRDTPGYDIGAFVSRSGMARTNRPPDEEPMNLKGAIGDHTTGMATCMAVLAALNARHQTGRGTLVETSLLQTGLYTMAMDLSMQMTLGRLKRMRPRAESLAPMVNSYQAGDGRWFYLIGLEMERHFPILCTAIGRPDLAEDPRFATAAGMVEHRVEMIAELDEVFAAHDLDRWARTFAEHDVWWAPCLTTSEVGDDPQVQALESFVPVVESGMTMTTVAAPARFNGRVFAPRRPVPELGEHSDEIRAELARRRAAST